MRFSVFISVLRSLGPVVIGVSLGFTLSLLSVSWTEETCLVVGSGRREDVTSGRDGLLKGARKPNSISAANDADSEEGFEPRIVPYKQLQPSAPKKVFRAKYISTELGMRERLFVGVLTSKNTINTLGAAVNRTISHHFDIVVFFTGLRNRKLPHGMFVVSHGDERLIWNMFQTVKYIFEHYINEYDWFYFVQDDSYTEADRIKALVEHLSMDRELYMGRPEEFIGGETEGKYCYGGFGYLLSRSLLLRLQPFLENCRNDILSSRPDEWLGRCIIDYTSTNCVGEYEGLEYHHYELGKNSDPSKEQSEQFKSALTVHPVSDPEQMYRLHRYFSEIELQRTYDEIAKLQAEIKNVSVVAFEGNRSAHWPVGISPPFEPKSRFEVLKWEYFTEEEIYSCIDEAPKCRSVPDLKGIVGKRRGPLRRSLPAAGEQRPRGLANRRAAEPSDIKAPERFFGSRTWSTQNQSKDERLLLPNRMDRTVTSYCSGGPRLSSSELWSINSVNGNSMFSSSQATNIILQ